MTDGTPFGGAADDRRAQLAERLKRRISERHYPLSYPQQRLWFLDQLDPDNAVYVVPLIYRISGPLDVAAMERALGEVVRRHHVLRTVYRSVGGTPRQFVRPAEPMTIPVRDLSARPEPAAEAEQEARREAARPFDLAVEVPVRPLLLRLAPDEHWFCLSLHHIACDGWSLGVLGSELSALYGAFTKGREPELAPVQVQYAAFAEEQESRLQGKRLEEMLGYWRERLAGAPALATLPGDRPRPPTQSHLGSHLDFAIGADVTERVGELARAEGATPFAVLLAAFAAVVHSRAGGDEVIVGSPVAGRTKAELQSLIGFFTNTVVQRVDVSGEPTFRQLVARARDESRSAVAHQELPFEKLVEELQPSRDPAHNPLFQLLFSYHEGDADGLVLPGCEVQLVPGDTETSKFDLTLSLTRTDDRLSARLEFSTGLFEEATARSIGDQFSAVLAAAVAAPDTPLRQLPVLSPDETRRVLVDWNPPAEPVPDVLIHELIAEQAARTPHAPALLGAEQRPEEAMTYRELDRRAEALAARLRARGVGADVPVGVYLDRSPALVVALLAVLKAGGAYLPLDPGYPADRIAFMAEDSRTPVIVTRAALARRIEGLPASPLLLDTPEPDATPAGAGGPAAAVSPQHLAYVIYTSGSTGRPKGVMVSHRNVQTFFGGMDKVLGKDTPDTWLAVTSMSFDISVLELLWTLAHGYRVIIRGDEPTRHSAGADGPAVTSSVQARPLDLSLFYFGGDRGGEPGDAYRLLIEGAKFADRNGFSAVWTPERHFHEFGGLYPNPSVTASAIAAITERVAVRAGSVVLPLHDPLRVAEEWSVVDNISHGRAGISVASGWQPDDFVLAPDVYADRKKAMMSGLDELRRLWRGETVRRRNGADAETDVRIFPPPVQDELPVWVTSARSPETFQLAGESGAGLLTHLLGHSVEQLAEKIRLYRQAWRDAGHPGNGQVTVMLHTFVGTDTDEVRETVREPLCAYIKSSFDLLTGLGQAMGQETDLRTLPEDELDHLVAQAFDRFFETSGLLGTPEHCADVIDRLKSIEVDEVACLIDFGVEHERVLASLEHLATTRELSESRRRTAQADEPIAAQLVRHGVTHLQCTPSVAGLLAEDDAAAAALPGLERLLVGGEALPAPLAERLAALLPGKVHNMYGPTEATVWATTASAGGHGPVTIGRPLANVRAYVVDAYLRPTPANAPGELLLGGPGVVRGYLGRPALSAERFIPDPFAAEPGARLYRTGDLVRRRADGELEFLGRLDHQVKVLGHRIELGEIENTLGAHPDVRNAVVAVRGEGGHSRLVAYCVPVPHGTNALTAPALRAFGAKSLPDYMVPADVVFLDALPMTANGKVDRGRLPALENRPAAVYRPPDNDKERHVAEALAEVLRAERIGMDDNFFEAGGNSLLAVQARARLQPVLGDRLSLVDIFRYPTARALVAAFDTAGAAGAAGGGGGLDRVREAAGRRADAFARQAKRRAGRSGA
ncbi:LLM class flavin-dependent oxidoreductase [Streptomyces sp. ISL-96]|uniref:MupA/Atu3671 family FMN-dependent luciferase-like monooxygenase n=1 Tax=Streptomyces sp. ISL-96 TaxID=2819191 RepID=UPI001BEA613A|nr:MupA/Atu3671 family FMN-dependent luciferase-like monooxygenase [Streptomyces sp. ISL-96]MBT2488423.1 LLM class flavin-dependent oxidoreductase [Streptomyces sp. ISL-96]